MNNSDRRAPGSEIGCIAITGGTGSFGSAFARFLLAETPCKIRLISRDEHKHEALMRDLNDARVTFILGDVRDEAKMRIVLSGADTVVHAAALKTVPAGERHIGEFVRTNIMGSEHVIRACWSVGVQRVLLVSSDKAVAALNAYGKTKAVAEEIFVQANQFGAARGLKSSVVRGGNVWGSRGSVVELWRRALKRGEALHVYDRKATRFHLPMSDWTRYCWRVLNEMHGGEIFVPKLRAWSLEDLARAFGGEVIYNGARHGDKRHESLVAPGEMRRMKSIDWSYVIEPSDELQSTWNYAPLAGHYAPEGAWYTSEHGDFLSVKELQELIR